MLQHYKILTVTHRRTSLKRIGQYVVRAENPGHLRDQLFDHRHAMGLQELMYAATCNRTLFLFTTPAQLDTDFVERFFQRLNPALGVEEIASEVDVYEGAAAVQHLLEVAASIDSLVIGERQILGQLRETYEQCLDWGLTGDDLRLLFQQAVGAAKDVYASTRIGEKPVSVVSLAVQKLLQLQLPKAARILLIGAGQTNNLVSKFLLKHGYGQVAVFNRTPAKAEALAARFGNRALSLEQLASYEDGFDCIFVCTGATDPILTPALYGQLLQDEAPAEKIIVDLAIPHNTATSVLEQYHPTYIEIEGLRSLAEENMAFREREISMARQLLAVHAEEFPLVYRQRQIEKAMRQVPVEIKEVRHRAMNEVFRKEMDSLDDQARALVDEMLRYMEKKCISIPMKAARQAFNSSASA
jgi:glutamyl-tRNA reductase